MSSIYMGNNNRIAICGFLLKWVISYVIKGYYQGSHSNVVLYYMSSIFMISAHSRNKASYLNRIKKPSKYKKQNNRRKREGKNGNRNTSFAFQRDFWTSHVRECQISPSFFSAKMMILESDVHSVQRCQACIQDIDSRC